MVTKATKAIALLMCFFLLIFAQGIRTVSFDELEKEWKKDNDTTYVVNFWATWCAPCVKELPHFERLDSTYKSQRIKVILVSLDFKSAVEKRLGPFVKKKGLQSTVIHLNDPDDNVWMPKVSNDWTGAIPATLVVNNRKGNSSFHEGEITYDKLKKLAGIK